MIVLDTHALIWWVSGSPRLSARARREVDKALRQGPVAASAISLVEIATAAGNLPDSMHGDPADRIIAATATALRGKLVTADRELRRSSHVETVW